MVLNFFLNVLLEKDLSLPKLEKTVYLLPIYNIIYYIISLMLPPIRTETGKRTFAFQGAQIFNKLPKDIPDEESLMRFKHKLRI